MSVEPGPDEAVAVAAPPRSAAPGVDEAGGVLPPFVPHTPEMVAEARQLNVLIEQFMDEAPTFATPDGLAQLRDNDGFLGQRGEVDVALGELPGPAGPVPTRTFVPEGEPAAVVLHLHGGGWCIGSAAAGDVPNRELADRAGVVVVSIDYRLAPEHPWPAGPDDCEAAALWLLEEGPRRWGCDRLVLAGGSAGAHLAAVTLLRLRDVHRVVDRVAGADLVFGAFDLGMTPSQRAAERALVIPTESLQACYRHLLPGLDREDRRDPSYSPLFADLAGLCPALFTVGTLDPLLDDSLFMAARWAAAGNDARLDLYPECPHGFPAFPIELGRLAQQRSADWIAEVLAR